MELVTYRISGKHGSIEDLEWVDVPAFCVVTGENGAGKTHLMEAIAKGYGLAVPADTYSRMQPMKAINTTLTIDGNVYSAGDAFYASTTWAPPVWGSATIQSVIEEGNRLYSARANGSAIAPDDPLYEKWEELTAEQETGAANLPPGWAKFEARLTPERLASHNHSQNLAFLFLSYVVLRASAVERAERLNQDSTHAIERLGPPPWTLFNTFCKEADVGFEIVPPTFARTEIFSTQSPPYVLRLLDLQRGTAVEVSEASSGERIMLSIIAWRFWAETSNHRYKAIILDEPDAHLHPSLVRKFLNVLRIVMVERHGARVIMTTHSPTTVALAPEGSVFELRRHRAPRIIPVENAAEIVAKLTGGLVAVGAATRFIVLEGSTDLPFFVGLWTLLSEAGLPSFPGVSFFVRNGCTKVKETVSFLREGSFKQFFGILDRDACPNENMPGDGVYVLDRNGIENYMFDPLNIWLCLWLEQRMPHSLHKIPDLRQGSGAQFRNLPLPDLQRVVDSVWAHIRPNISCHESRMDEPVMVAFHGGVTLKYPRWFIEADDHSMATTVRSSFERFPFPPKNLHQSYMTLNMITEDLWRIFSSITS